MVLADKLLPLSADVEVSDFPTLEEVEQMAIEGSLYAHSSKPDSLPATSNTKWKDDVLEGSSSQSAVTDVRLSKQCFT